MSNIIIPKRSTVAGKLPLSTDLQIGEIAINLADCLLYSKDASGVVVQIGGGGGVPSQSGNGGKYLTTDGSAASWATIGSFSDTVFAITDNADATKKAVFEASGITTGTTVTLTLPNVSATLAHLGNVSQSFAGSVSFNNAAGFFGMSTANSSSTLGGGATLSGNTKTVLIGSAGASGSTTNVNIGSAVSGATTNVTINGTSFNFASAGARFTADFSNATLANRLWFQTSTADSSTSLFAVPSGTGNSAAWTAFAGSDPSNAAFVQMLAGTGEHSIRANKNGTGSYLPLAFYVNNAKAFQVGTAGQWGIGATPDYGTAGYFFKSGGGSAAPTWGALTSSEVTTALGYTPVNPTTSQTAKFVYAAPNAANGAPSFRALLASDIPTLNQNTTGSAATLTTSRTLTIGNTGKSFDGSAAVSWSLSEIGAYAATNPSGFITSSGSISGSSRYLVHTDGPRNLTDRNPNWAARNAIFDFVGAGTTGTGGSYAGVLTFVPWDGTTSSTGDASYQLAFGSTAANGGGTPQLRIRKGIDTTWNGWYDILTNANYNSYSPTLTGGNASGTWGISVTGTASNITSYTINQNVGTGNQVTFDSVITGNNGNGTNVRLGDDCWIGDANVANTFRVQGNQNAANGYIIFGNGDTTALGRSGTGALTYGGSFTASGNVSGNSDETLKTNWRPLQRNFVEMLASVKHGIYDRIDIEATQVGVSAQSLQLVLEHAVSKGDDGKLAVAYGNAALVSAIALAERVVELEQRLEKLEN